MGSESEHTTLTAEVLAVTQAESAALGRTPQSVVLDLQRGHGNAAVARLMAGNAKNDEEIFDSHRFDDHVFRVIAKGGKGLAKGDRGPEVGKLQQALVDAGHTIKKVDGHFGEDTRQALIAFQQAQGLGENGKLDKRTLLALDALYATRKPYVDDAQAFDPHDPGGRELTEGQKDDVQDALAPAKPGKFKETVGGKKYGNRIKFRLEKLIDHLYERNAGGDKKDKRKDPAKNFYSWDTLEGVAVGSKQVTDDLYGTVVPGPQPAPFSHKKHTLMDQWVQTEADIAGYDETEAHDSAWYFLWYLIPSNCADISREHNAVPDNPAEGQILYPIVYELVDTKAKVQKVLDIQKGWDATAWNGVVNIQRFKADTDKGNREQMWKLFHICIHEYIHTLTHKNWYAYGDKYFGNDEARHNTLIEGFCDFFTKNVRSTVAITPPLQKQVEGPYYDENKKAPEVKPSVYPSIAQAEAVVSIVGIRNAELGFFRGELDKIGGAPDKRGDGK
jgi:Putative peptidoglycan binding domain